MTHIALFSLALLTFSTLPASAQCCSSHGGHHSNQTHSEHQESSTKVKATNTICPVMGRAVKSGRDREVVIRGNYYLVCCDGCGPEMSEHYEKYFDKAGNPLNDPKRREEKTAPTQSAHEGHQH